MGITGLLPFIKKSSRTAHVREFSGCTVAVDAYCWLHKGASSCADKLTRGEKTDGYVFYCMKIVNMLLSYNVKPILVFDGRNLPSKADTERKRRQTRELNRQKGREFLRSGHIAEARSCFQRCVDVTPSMALEVIKACRLKGVDCIVAPYEADAQLAFFSTKGIAQLIITEDSDLLLFGCEQVLFKMDVNGGGILVERSKLHLSFGQHAAAYTFDKFRYMCILSGCDYLPSLPGIGLVRACKFFSISNNPDVHGALRRLPLNLNLPTLQVSKEYRDLFMRANNTFLYQLVFDPMSRKVVPLTLYPEDIDKDDLNYAGERLNPKTEYQLALGNLDIHTFEKVDHFDPDARVNPNIAASKSIWSKNYTIVRRALKTDHLERISATGKVVNVILPTSFRKSVKRASDGELPRDQLMSEYGDLNKRLRLDDNDDEIFDKISEDFPTEGETCFVDSQEVETEDYVPKTPTKHYNPFATVSASKSPDKQQNPFAVTPRKLDVNISSGKIIPIKAVDVCSDYDSSQKPTEETELIRISDSSSDVISPKHHNPFVKASPSSKTSRQAVTHDNKFSALIKFAKIRKTIIDTTVSISSKYFSSKESAPDKVKLCVEEECTDSSQNNSQEDEAKENSPFKLKPLKQSLISSLKWKGSNLQRQFGHNKDVPKDKEEKDKELNLSQSSVNSLDKDFSSQESFCSSSSESKRPLCRVSGLSKKKKIAITGRQLNLREMFSYRK